MHALKFPKAEFLTLQLFSMLAALNRMRHQCVQIGLYLVIYVQLFRSEKLVL